MRKYLYDFIVLQEVEDETLLPALEKEWIKKKNSYIDGYNMTEGGESYNLKGEYHSQAKLSQKEVNQIIELLQENKISQAEIAKKFNVSTSSISLINTGKH